MKRRIWIALISTLFLAEAAAAQEPADTWIFGQGQMSCATWLRAANAAPGEVWILGFWSGLNVKNPQNHAVGSTTDAQGIIAEVRLVCEREPSLPLFGAATEVYWRMDGERR